MNSTTNNAYVSPDEEKLANTVFELAEKSLKEVKALTEYEDQKAQRILTGISFLATFGGVLFSQMVQKASLERGCYLWATDCHSTYQSISLMLAYGIFLVFSMLFLIGAAVTIYAVSPRFTKFPKVHIEGPSEYPSSFLFYKEIIRSKDIAFWIDAFKQTTAEKLRKKYADNFVLETHLVAQKVAIKIKLLERGVRLFFWGTIVFAIWLPFLLNALFINHLSL